MEQLLTLGFDIGSVSINAVVVDARGQVVKKRPYRRHFGRIVPALLEELRPLMDEFARDGKASIAFTGTHGKTIASALGACFDVETTATTVALAALEPELRTVVAIGGHDSALLTLKPGPDGKLLLSTFKLNEACAAGTGSFIDQQAERIFAEDEALASIEDPQDRIEAILETFIAEGKTSDSPANVACRCTVFTKSDMIHLQNKGIPIRHIIKGLHEGVAKNFVSTLVSNQTLESPIAFIGGYTQNALARESFEKILGAKVEIPEHAIHLGAIGVALKAQQEGSTTQFSYEDVAALSKHEALQAPRTEALSLKLSDFKDHHALFEPDTSKGPVACYLGFDIGSTTTKVALLTPEGELFYKRYMPTEGQPVIAIKKGLRELRQRWEGKIEILGVGTTGSGREVAALFCGADDVVNEVTAHALGTTFYNPEIDTIFELGGQDAKYTSLKDGRVIDFRMNKVCAAGTGSFLEETANKLGIAIDKEYEGLAMASKAPLSLAERCTVYMEADLMSYLQQGAPKEDLLAGLSYAVVHNYLNRVVGTSKVGDVISFQGGPSLNKSVVAAFERITGKAIVTLPHREMLGAIGAALHAKAEVTKRREAEPSYLCAWRGFDIVEEEFIHREEVCKRNPKCHNLCKLQIYEVGGHQAIYGGDCGLYESRSRATEHVQNFHKIRQNLYFKAMKGRYRSLEELERDGRRDRPTVGIPQTLHFHQYGLLWVHLLAELGLEPIITPETDDAIANQGIEAMTCETCFPIKIAHGHVRELQGKVDYIFLPNMIEMEGDKKTRQYYCPLVESAPWLFKAALGLRDDEMITPTVHLKLGDRPLKKELRREFKRLGLPFRSFGQAWRRAMAAQQNFKADVQRVGKATLERLGDRKAVVVLSRPYSLYDERTNLNLFRTFSRLGVTAIPMEFLDLGDIDVSELHPNMYWGFGANILRAGRRIIEDPRLFGLYLTSFACGPDSFILHFFDEQMNEAGRPYLELELDEHSAGAGVETRILAFLDVIGNYRVEDDGKSTAIRPRKATAPLKGRKIYLPRMAEGAECLAAAFQAVGIDAATMPTYSERGLEFGKRHTSGKECFPCIVTTGDMFDLIHDLVEQGIDVLNEVAFFMPETEGPCRFGQYNQLHHMLLESYGYEDVPILSPSSEDSYRCDGLLSDEQATTFRKLAWQGIAVADILEKALWRVRPYETEAGLSDRIFQESLAESCEAIRQGGGDGLVAVAEKAARRFIAVPRRLGRRPLVGIVGEIFVRTHAPSNQNLVRKLEALGLETMTSSIAEWIEYTSLSSLEDSMAALSWRPKSWATATKDFATRHWQRFTYGRLFEPFQPLLAERKDHKTEHIIKSTEGIFSPAINGEAILSIGSALNFARDGFDGVINCMPFTCMPSTVATAILKVQLADELPYIDMVYDGTILPNRETNLSTFAYQVQQRYKARQAEAS